MRYLSMGLIVRQLLIATFLVLAACGTGNADTYQPKIELGPWAGKLKVGPGMICKGHRLWGSEIVGQDLTGTSFDDCNLNGLTLRQCNLRGATFRRAIFDGFQIDDCEFGNNDFTDVVLNGFLDGLPYGALPLTLDEFKSTWSFKNKNLNDCEIAIREGNRAPLDLDLRKFQMLRTKFYFMDLSLADFDEARFYRIEMRYCRLNFERFRRASGTVSDCKFLNTEFLGHVDFQRKWLTNSVISGPMSTVDTRGAIIYGLHASQWLDGHALSKTKSYAVGDLSLCRFGCDLSGADLSSQLLSHTMFTGCDLTDCKFDDAVISFARFHDCKGLTVEQIKSTWNYRHNRMDGIELPSHILAQTKGPGPYLAR